MEQHKSPILSSAGSDSIAQQQAISGAGRPLAADSFDSKQTGSDGAMHGPVLPVPQTLGAAARPVQPITANPILNDNPLAAADEDVIEKEWVDKAKKIVAQTKNDPREQEKEVSKLQADYLKKRYGKEIKLIDD